MNLYLISQDVNRSYDTYDSAVVAAESEEAARMTRPDSDPWPEGDKRDWTWAKKPENVKVKLIGTAADGIPAGVVCASFNAG